jgi:trehalose/maltose hydrolase-like predicted phosphorylase
LKDLQYYETRVPDRGTPAMTYSIFTLLYSKLKNSTLAYKNFKESFVPFLKKPFGVFSETKGGSNPYFLTGAGGVLQSMIFGFGGFNIGEKGIYFTNNSIPAEWKKVTIKT